MAFPNLGQMPASTQVGMAPRPMMLPKKKALKKPALDPRGARAALVKGIQGC